VTNVTKEKAMSDDAVVQPAPNYWGNVLTSFENGAQMDLRLKLAIQFISGLSFAAVLERPSRADDTALMLPQEAAAYALDLAGELLDQAAARGLVKDMPDHGELNAPTRHQIERNARAQVYGQTVGQRVMREESGGVMPMGASAMPQTFGG
jgi:hypothetical protein